MKEPSDEGGTIRAGGADFEAARAQGQGESTDGYASVVKEVMAGYDAEKALSKDQDAVCARVVAELKKVKGWKEGESEEPLFQEARRMYWDWESKQRKKERSGQEELACCEPC